MFKPKKMKRTETKSALSLASDQLGCLSIDIGLISAKIFIFDFI